MLKKLLRKKIKIDYRTFFMFLILLFGGIIVSQFYFYSKYVLNVGSLFFAGSFISFVVLFLIYDEKK